MENNIMVSKFRRIMQTICGIVIVVILTTAIVGCVNPGTTSGGEPIGDTVSDTKKEDAKKIADTKGNEPSIFNTQTSAQKREEDRDARDAQSTTQRENRHTEPRIEERPKETPTFEKMADGTIWYNNEKDNYTFKFPGWLGKEFNASGNLELSGNALNKVELSQEQTFTTDNFTITVKWLPAPEGTSEEIDAWFANLTKNFDETMTYNGWNFPVEAIADSGGPFARRALAQINDNGALEVKWVYYSTPESRNMTFQKKAKDAFGMIVSSAMELYLSD